MNKLISAAVAATILAAPAISFAQQSNDPVSRAQVNGELQTLQSAGYNVNDHAHYPRSIQTADARVDSAQGTAPVAQTDSYGYSANGTSQSGGSATGARQQSVYFGE